MACRPRGRSGGSSTSRSAPVPSARVSTSTTRPAHPSGEHSATTPGGDYPARMTQEGELLWTPSAQRRDNARITNFMHWLAAHRGHTFATYDDLLQWSIDDIEGFWSAASEWLRVRWHVEPQRALAKATMPGAKWFHGGRLNYAEHLLFPSVDGLDAEATAVYFVREDGVERSLSGQELRTQVGAVRSWLAQCGVGVGARVAALLPNCPERSSRCWRRRRSARSGRRAHRTSVR